VISHTTPSPWVDATCAGSQRGQAAAEHDNLAHVGKSKCDRVGCGGSDRVGSNYVGSDRIGSNSSIDPNRIHSDGGHYYNARFVQVPVAERADLCALWCGYHHGTTMRSMSLGVLLFGKLPAPGMVRAPGELYRRLVCVIQ
jgi:hypothetical protein